MTVPVCRSICDVGPAGARMQAGDVCLGPSCSCMQPTAARAPPFMAGTPWVEHVHARTHVHVGPQTPHGVRINAAVKGNLTEGLDRALH